MPLVCTLSCLHLLFSSSLMNDGWMKRKLLCLFFCVVSFSNSHSCLIFAPSNLHVTTTSPANSFSVIQSKFLLLISTENNWSPSVSPPITPLSPVSPICFLLAQSLSVSFPFPSTSPFNQCPHHLLSTPLVRLVKWQRNVNWTMAAISTHKSVVPPRHPLVVRSGSRKKRHNNHHLILRNPPSWRRLDSAGETINAPGTTTNREKQSTHKFNKVRPTCLRPRVKGERSYWFNNQSQIIPSSRNFQWRFSVGYNTWGL